MKDENREKTRELFSKIIHDAVEQNASDIHFECFEKTAKIRFRVDGVLNTVKTIGREEHQDLCEAIKEMFKGEVQENRLPQDGRIQLSINKKHLDLRVSTAPCIYGESICIRILRKEALCLDIARAGFSTSQMETIKKWYGKPNGTILLTGPTGSGKTTVLYMILNQLNKDSQKVFSVEDPVEYAFEGINQMSVNPKAGLTFSRAMRTILRQDPDVIMVGEIRDLETSYLVVQASLTGHLVLSTLHTNTATDAVIRLKDIGVEPFLIRDSLNGIISQRLVRALCKECRKPYVPDGITLKYLGLQKQEYYKAVGCSKCHDTGYHRRIGIYELFEPSHSSMNMLLKGCSAEEFRRQAIAEGMTTLFKDGISKAAQGITSLEEVVSVTEGIA